MNDKMNDPVYVTRKVKIASHDYSKENLLATFTPQKQLTPEQIFWSSDLMKLKSEALKERTKKVEAILKSDWTEKNQIDNFLKERRSKSKNIGIVPTEMELILEQNQQGISHEVSAQNDLFRAENDKIKQHYKELYDSIKIKRAKHIEQVTKLTTENVNLKTCVSKATVNPQVSTRDKHAIDVEPIVLRLRKNRDAHLDYLMHLKESVKTIRDIIEEAKVVRPLDRSIVSACRYTKHSQELLEKKQVIVAKPSDKSDSTTHRHVVIVKSQKTNVHVPPFTGVNSCPNARGSQPKSHVKANKISPAKGDNKLPVDDQPRKNKSHLRTSNRIDSSSRLKRTVIRLHSDSICQTCNKCLTPFNHDLCVATCLQSAMATPSTRHNCEVERKIKQVWKPKPVGKVWKPTGKVLTTIGHQWRPTG
nr:hypothetical protein [Tanacetum cinerariifolium]